MSFNDIEDVLDAGKIKPKPPKRIEPIRAPSGEVIPEYDEKAHAIGERVPEAIPYNPRADNPLWGVKCSVKRCGEPAQYQRGGHPDGSFEVPVDPYMPPDDSLVAQIEAARLGNRPMAGVQIPEVPVTYLCIKHYYEAQELAAKRAEDARKASEPESWYLPLTNWEGARVEMCDDGDHFMLVEANGRAMKLETYRLPEVMAGIQGRPWVQQVLSAEDREKFRLTVAAEEALRPVASQAAANAIFALGK